MKKEEGVEEKVETAWTEMGGVREKKTKKRQRMRGAGGVVRRRAGIDRKVNERKEREREKCWLTYLQDKTKSSVSSKCRLD